MRIFFLFILFSTTQSLLAQSLWSAVNMDPYRRAFDFTESSSGHIYISTYGAYSPYEGSVYKSTDNGISFTKTNLTLPYIYTSGIVVANNNNIIVGTFGNGVYLSSDGGASWSHSNTGLPSDSNSTIGDIRKTSNGTIFLIDRNSGILYKSTNNGLSWAANNSSKNFVNGKFKIGPSDVFYCSNDTIFKSTDLGTTWTALPNQNYIVEAYYVHTNGDLYAGMKYGAGYLFRLSNGSNTWTQLNSTAFAGDFTDIKVNSSNYIFTTHQADLATKGIYRSIDNGSTFTNYNTGLPDKYDYAMHLLSNGHILVSNGGAGIYKTLNNTNSGTSLFEQNYTTNNIIKPNPVSDKAVLDYSLSKHGIVKINIIDMSGKIVKEILNEEKEPGNYMIEINSEDISSGIYTCEIISENNNTYTKMVISK